MRDAVELLFGTSVSAHSGSSNSSGSANAIDASEARELLEAVELRLFGITDADKRDLREAVDVRDEDLREGSGAINRASSGSTNAFSSLTATSGAASTSSTASSSPVWDFRPALLEAVTDVRDVDLRATG